MIIKKPIIKLSAKETRLGVEAKKKSAKSKNLLKIEFVKNINGSIDKYVNNHISAKNKNIADLDLYVLNTLLFVPNTKGKRTVKIIVDGKDKTSEIIKRLKIRATKDGMTSANFRMLVYKY